MNPSVEITLLSLIIPAVAVGAILFLERRKRAPDGEDWDSEQDAGVQAQPMLVVVENRRLRNTPTPISTIADRSPEIPARRVGRS
jgi:hypothetical protein